MDALDVRVLGERFDVVSCLGVLRPVTAPTALLGALEDVLAPGGEIVLETYGSRLPDDVGAIEVHEPGEVYARDDFVCGDWGRIAGVDEVEVVDELEIDGHARIVAELRRPADPAPRSPPPRSGCPRHVGQLVVQCRRSIGGDRVDVESGRSRGERGVVDVPVVTMRPSSARRSNRARCSKKCSMPIAVCAAYRASGAARIQARR